MAKQNVSWMNERYSIRFGSTTYTGAPVPTLTALGPVERYVIVAGNREYNGGPGYGGAMCSRAHVVPRKVYGDATSADRARVSLAAARGGGGSFRTVPWKP